MWEFPDSQLTMIPFIRTYKTKIARLCTKLLSLPDIPALARCLKVPMFDFLIQGFGSFEGD